MKQTHIIHDDHEKGLLLNRIAEARVTMPWRIEVSWDNGRTIPQNNHLHPVIRQIAKHMEAHGAPKRKEDWWRHYFVGKFLGQEVIQDPDGSGGVIVMNKASGTSGLSKQEAAKMLDWLYAFGVEIGVEFKA